MACELSIYKEGQYVFKAEPVSLTKVDEIKKLFLLLDEKFPEEKGFELQIERSQPQMLSIPRSVFRQACQSDDWRDLINCFVLEDEFIAFCKQVTFMHLDEAYYHIDDLHYQKNLTVVRCYQGVMTIFERSKDRKVFQIFGHSDFESEDLLAVERELYRLYIKTHNSFAYPSE